MNPDTHRTCVIVGNGTSLLDAKNGARIDGFETVVRFNLFETRGYEKHVGSKTDIWFTGLDANACGWRVGLPYRQIYAHSWASATEGCKAFKSFREKLPDADVQKVPHSIRGEMARYAGTSYDTWSTGALAVWLLAQQFPILHLTGFDWWERDAQHYFMPKANRGTLHKPEIEKVFIDRMRAEGRLEFL